MHHPLILAAFVIVLASAQEPARERDEFREVFLWKHVDFAWQHDSDKARALDTRAYAPENVALQAVRAWREWLFVTLPRWRAGVPATLCAVRAAAPQPAPLLMPFPSWGMQTVGDCSAIQSAQAIDITPQGRLWVVDGGRAATLDAPTQDACPPKVIIFDLDASNVSASRVWQTLLLPPHVLSPKGDSAFGDVAVDADDVAYVADASATDPGVIVVDARAARVWKARDAASMRPAAQYDANVQGGNLSNSTAAALALLPGGVTALALESDAMGRGRRLFFAPLRSRNLFAVEAAALRDEATASDAAALSVRVQPLGNKTSASAALAAGAGVGAPLYLALNDIFAVARWDAARGPLDRNTQVLVADSERLQWPSSLSMDRASGTLWVVSNRLPNFLAGAVNVDEPNYRVMRAFVGDGTGTPPPQPSVSTSFSPSPVPTTPHQDADTMPPASQKPYHSMDLPSYNPQHDKFNYTTRNNNHSMDFEHKGNNGVERLRVAVWSLVLVIVVFV